MPPNLTLPRSNPPEQLSIHINQESCITMPTNTIDMTYNNSLMKDLKHKSGSVSENHLAPSY